MLRSHFEFAYVICIIFIPLVASVSFEDFCSDELSCHNPLICSNSSQCICPISSFWNTEQNTCLSCPSEWIQWQNETCLLFVTTSEGGIRHEKARNACLTHSAQLLQIDNYQDLMQFQYKINELMEGEDNDTFIKFLTNGIWINFTDHTDSMNSNEWCDTEYDNDMSSQHNCIRLIKKHSEKADVKSLCLHHTYCNEKLPYICQRFAEIIEDNNETNSFANMERALTALIGPAINLLGGLFGSNNQQPPPEPQQPNIHIISVPSEPHAQLPSKSPSTTSIILYVLLGVSVFVIIIVLLLCFCGGGLFFIHTTNKVTPMETGPRPSMYRPSQMVRNSTDTTASDISYISR